MTVCIGAMCCSTNASKPDTVVVASDRMVTMGGRTEFEPARPKIVKLTERVVALTSGDTLKGAELLRGVKAALAADGQTVRSVAEDAANIYANLRKAQINADIFAPRGMDIGSFYNGGLQTRLMSHLAAALDEQVAKFDFGLQLIVAGTDGDGAHLYEIRNPGGRVFDWDPIGFEAIGTGAFHAIHSFIGSRHTANRSIMTTVFDVYLAKKRGEAAPGVGTDTDMLVIGTGTKVLSEGDLQKLEKMMAEYQKPADQSLSDRIKTLSIFESRDAQGANARN